MKNLAVFASGNGTNFEAICEAVKKGDLNLNIALLVCDKDCFCLKRAEKYNVKSVYINPKFFKTKQEYEEKIVEYLKSYGIDYIALAGYMRLIGDNLLNQYEGRIVNIHPSLLPAFKGKDAIGQAFNYGVKIMGVSIHYVNKEMDGGKIIAQQAFYLDEFDNYETVEKKVHEIEHVLYPKTLKMWEE